MSFPRYPEVKDSGVEWLGEVPEHWEVTKLSYITNRIGSGKTPLGGASAYVSSGVPFIRSQNVHDQGLRLDDIVYIDEATDREMAWSRVRPLDVLINITGASIGRSCQVPAGFGRANVNQHVCVIRMDKSEEASGWVAWAMKAPSTKEQVKVSQTGAAREGLNFEQLAGFYLCMPSLKERRKISAFLDHETARIDALVEEQQRLIALLKEKRQAVISHAVTKGLDPDVPMKDSGVEWLGLVPAHWEIFPIKRDLDFLTSGSRGWASHYSDDGAAFIRIGNLTRDHINLDLTDLQRVSVPEGSEGERTKVKEQDLLFSITAYLGSVAVVPAELETAYVSQHIALARLLKKKLLPSWVAYVTLSDVGKNYLSSQGYGGTKIQLSLEDVAELLVTAPPLDEQAAITSSLDNEIARIDALAQEGESVIKLLQERRSALISAAVTGKIDVRGWQPPEDSPALTEATQSEMV